MAHGGPTFPRTLTATASRSGRHRTREWVGWEAQQSSSHSMCPAKDRDGDRDGSHWAKPHPAPCRHIPAWVHRTQEPLAHLHRCPAPSPREMRTCFALHRAWGDTTSLCTPRSTWRAKTPSGTRAQGATRPDKPQHEPGQPSCPPALPGAQSRSSSRSITGGRRCPRSGAGKGKGSEFVPHGINHLS